MSNISMPEEFIRDVAKLIVNLQYYEQPAHIITLMNKLDDQITAKLDRIQRRKLYTTYKTAQDGNVSEAARQQYLDKAGIHEDFRWPAGYDPNDPATVDEILKGLHKDTSKDTES